MVHVADFDEYAHNHLHYFNEEVAPLLERYLRSSTYDSFLDCGCGDGSLLWNLRRAGLLMNKRVFAIDVSPVRIARIRTLDPEIHANVDSAETLETIADSAIDFLASTQVIEHVDDRKMLASIARVTRKGATVYLTTVWKKWYAWYFYRSNGSWALDPTHLREYKTDRELLDLVDGSTFELLENRKVPVSFPVLDFVMRRARCSDIHVFENRVLGAARRIKVPILGYFTWELVLRRR